MQTSKESLMKDMKDFIAE